MRVSSFFGLVALALGVAPLATAAHAADMHHVETAPGKGVIVVTGDIVLEDSAKFRSIAANYRSAVVVFASKGGSLSAGLAMGEAIRARKFETRVSAGAMCASACALAWLGGEQRAMSASARIGFHASFVIEEGKARESAVGNALVGAYITRLGLPIDAVIAATQASPREMNWLSPNDAERLGIGVKVTDARPSGRSAPTLGDTDMTSGGGPALEAIPAAISRTPSRMFPTSGEGGAS